MVVVFLIQHLFHRIHVNVLLVIRVKIVMYLSINVHHLYVVQMEHVLV
jgi:hypothetical protein